MPISKIDCKVRGGRPRSPMNDNCTFAQTRIVQHRRPPALPVTTVGGEKIVVHHLNTRSTAASVYLRPSASPLHVRPGDVQIVVTAVVTQHILQAHHSGSSSLMSIGKASNAPFVQFLTTPPEVTGSWPFINRCPADCAPVDAFREVAHRRVRLVRHDLRCYLLCHRNFQSDAVMS